jgi:hypothetical protein
MRLLDLSAVRRIKRYKPDFISPWWPIHHFQSLRSNSFGAAVCSRCSSFIAEPAAPNASPPTFTGSALRRDDQPIILNAQLDRIAQPALLDEGLGNANAAGVADTHQFASHRLEVLFCVITL